MANDQGVLTRKMLDAFVRQMEAESSQLSSEPVMYCHALEYPFYNALYNWHVTDIVTVLNWKNECFRKYFMGDKKRIEKWSLNNLIAQYTAKLESLRSDGEKQ